MTDWTNEQLCQRHGELASRSLTEDLQADEETELQAVRAELDRRDPTDLSAFEEHVRRVEQLADHVDEVRDTFLEELLAWTPSAETLAMAEQLLEKPMPAARFPVQTLYATRRQYGEDYCPRFVPWSFVAPHERRAQRNHGGQSLRRLAERGGLSVYELRCLVTDQPLFPVTDDFVADVTWLRAALDTHDPRS